MRVDTMVYTMVLLKIRRISCWHGRTFGVCVCKRIFSGEDGAIQKFHLVIYRFFDPLNWLVPWQVPWYIYTMVYTMVYTIVSTRLKSLDTNLYRKDVSSWSPRYFPSHWILFSFDHRDLAHIPINPKCNKRSLPKMLENSCILVKYTVPNCII
jgi:hypothetical protein